MDKYITGSVIKKMREGKGITQSELADRIGVSDKAVSKWETGKSYPDITLVEPIAEALGLSMIELLNGETIRNNNKSFNFKRVKFYVCPICGNIIYAMGESVVSCCGLVLPPLEAEHENEGHEFKLEVIEDEYYISIDHPMTKAHYISFIAGVYDNSMMMTKLYPEGRADTRFKISRLTKLYAYCNKHGFFEVKIGRGGKK